MGTRALTENEVRPLSEATKEHYSNAVPMYAAVCNVADQQVVRLVSEPLVTVTETIAQMFGGKLQYATKVGVCGHRAAGFPDWPILQDPDNAHHALNLVKDLEWSRRNAISVPGKVKQRFDVLAGRLSSSAPHFLPTLFEEIARIWFYAGNSHYAKQYFGKARQCELSYSLPLDPERHQGAFLEFAHMGIIGAKELKAESNNILDWCDDPTAVFHYVISIHRAQLAAGTAPYADAVRDLRKLGAAAGLTAAAVEREIVRELFTSRAVLNAPGAFWKQINKTLVACASKDGSLREFLLKQKPKSLNVAEYFALLEACGALQELRLRRTEHVQWLHTFLHGLGFKEFQEDPAALLTEIDHAGERLEGKEFEIPLHYLSPNIIDALLQYGATFAPKLYEVWNCSLRWDLWLDKRFDHCRRPLVYVAEHKQCAEIAMRNLAGGKIATQAATFIKYAGSRKLLRAKMDSLAEQLYRSQGSFENIAKIVEESSDFSNPVIYQFDPERIAKMFAYNAVDNLQAAVRAGVLAELTWPVFEDAIERIQNHTDKDKRHDWRVLEDFPAAVLQAGTEFEILDGSESILSGTLPANCEDINTIRHIGDDVLIDFSTKNSRNRLLHWLGTDTTKEVSRAFYASEDTSISMADGRITGAGRIRPYEYNENVDYGRVFANGAPDSPVYIAGIYHPATRHNPDHNPVLKYVKKDFTVVVEGTTRDFLQSLGVLDLGFDLEDLLNSADLNFEKTVIIPAQPTTTESPFGVCNGMHVNLVFESNGRRTLVNQFGVFSDVEHLEAVIARPGGGVWLVDGNANLYALGADDKTYLPIEEYSAVRGVKRLPLFAWHQLRPRDVETSTAMRNYSRAQAEALLHAFENSKTSARKLVQQQLGTDDALLIDAVLSIAGDAVRYGQQFQSLSTPNQSTSALGGTVVTEKALKGLSVFMEDVRWTNPQEVTARVMQLSKFMADSSKAEACSGDFDSVPWLELAGNERNIIGLLGAPLIPVLVDHQELRELIWFLKQATKAGIFGSEWRYLTVNLGDVDDLDVLEGETVVDGCLVIDCDWDWDSDDEDELRYVWGKASVTSVGGFPVQQEEFAPLPAAEFLACLEAIENNLVARQLDPAVAAAISRETGLTPSAVTHIFGGFVEADCCTKTNLTKAQREVLGFSLREAKAVRVEKDHYEGVLRDLVSAAVPAHDPMSYINGVVDVDAVIKCWNKKVPASSLRLKEEEFFLLYSHFRYSMDEILGQLLSDDFTLLKENPRDYSLASHYLGALLLLAETFGSRDPRRRVIAQKLTALNDALKAQRLSESEYQQYFATIDFGADEDEALLRAHHRSLQTQSLRLLLDGHLNNLIESLQGDCPFEGCAWDPLQSAPDIVASIAQHFEIGTDAARYYLQLAALVNPSDVNIRRWNGWKTKDIQAAGAELQDRDLVVEAKRTGSGRRYFLSGGWLPGSSSTKPMETWKAPLYLLWRSATVSPLFEGIPLLMPHREVFEQVWLRLQQGETPGFEEIRTERYRGARQR